jgi:hypothetical protein
MTTKQIDPRIKKHLETPTLITNASKNALKINSDFLTFEKCSVLIHVLIPEKGKTKPLPFLTKFLIGHPGTSIETGRDEYGYVTSDTFDLFIVRQNSNGWQLTMSNHEGRWLYPFLNIPDRTKPGWHQFAIVWDRTKPLLTFYIHGKNGGSVSTSNLQFWPSQLGKTVSIGATFNPQEDSFYDGTYIETELAHLWIVPDFLTTDHPTILNHRQLKF